MKSCRVAGSLLLFRTPLFKFQLEMPEELSDWSTIIPLTVKNIVLFYLCEFVANNIPYITHNVLVGNIQHLFCI